MTVANPTASTTKGGRFRLPAGKGNELRGILFGLLGFLLLLALVSHKPTDPSFLHQISGGTPRTANWIGAFGAQASALAYGLFGLTSLAVPFFLLVAGVRRLRHVEGEEVPVGRGLGAALLLISLPGVLQIALGVLRYRGGDLDAGGAFGKLLSSFLEARLNLPGALLVLGAGVLIALVLLVQSTLGEILAGWRARIGGAWESWRLGRARRREQKEKELAKKEIEQSHRAMAIERKASESAEETGESFLRRRTPPRAAAAISAEEEVEEDEAPGPLRVIERRGEAAFHVRRVAGPAPAFDPSAYAAPPFAEVDLDDLDADVDHFAEAPTVPKPARKATAKAARATKPKPQPELPFPDEPTGTALPPVNLLQISDQGARIDENELIRQGEAIRQRCAEFGVEGSIEGIAPGPVITVYEFQPAPGVKVSQIVNLQDDLALTLKAESVRIDRLAGRSTLGMEVPNRERQTIRLGSLLARDAFLRAPSVLTMALGVTIHGEPYYADLATMPHLLVAGATGAGKSVGLQSMITSILYKATRDQVQFIFIDPKRIELGVYADIPNLRTPVVVEPKQAANVLGHMVSEMENRYKKLAKVHVRSIAHYNQAISDPEHRKRLALGDGEGDLDPDDFQPMPYFVIIIDELADLMMVSSADVETAIARLAQMARAVGIHLIVATQRPSVDVLTGTIKANFPCRISYATASRHDSRTILDQVGSEKLLGKGDMLFMPPGSARVQRLHGAYVSEQETAGLIRWLKKQGKPDYDLSLLEAPVESRGGGEMGDADDDLYDEASRLVVAERMASASFLQRRMRIGFSRASRLIDMMEREGLLGPPQGSKPREVLVPRDYFDEVDATK